MKKWLLAIAFPLMLWLLGFAVLMTRGFILIALLIIGVTIWVGWIGWGFGQEEKR